MYDSVHMLPDKGVCYNLMITNESMLFWDSCVEFNVVVRYLFQCFCVCVCVQYGFASIKSWNEIQNELFSFLVTFCSPPVYLKKWGEKELMSAT